MREKNPKAAKTSSSAPGEKVSVKQELPAREYEDTLPASPARANVEESPLLSITPEAARFIASLMAEDIDTAIVVPAEDRKTKLVSWRRPHASTMIPISHFHDVLHHENKFELVVTLEYGAVPATAYPAQYQAQAEQHLEISKSAASIPKTLKVHISI